MNILIAPDKFKGSLTANEVCEAVREALLEMNSSHEISEVPLADGGEGTFEILLENSRGNVKKISVLDPLKRPIRSEYGLSKNKTTAFIEMAKASGLQLLKKTERNPLLTSTIGVGQLIADALDEGVTNIIIGIGGSATNDAGIGMAHALGFRFLNNRKEILNPIGQSLSDIHSIDDTQVDFRLSKVNFTVLCDVVNPLYGEHGAAHVYSPQKGATSEDVQRLDQGLKHLALLIKQTHQVDLNFPGAGAAGGMGAGAKFFLNATLRKGIDYISELTGLEEKINACDIVITGEGKVDEQTFSGKVVAHVLDLANQYHKPVFILCGQCTLTIDELQKYGAHRMITLVNYPSELNAAIANPVPLIKSQIQKAFLNLT